MSERYKLILENATDQPWHFGVYQKVPSSPGLSSVAWQVRGVPPTASDRHSQAEVNWTMDYGVCIAKFDKDEASYTGSQFAPALLSNNYRVASLDGVPSIESKPVGVGSADQIILKNETGPPAVTLSMGFTVSNNIIAVEDNVGGGQETIYRVHPTYYVACYRSIKLGQLVDAGIVIGPVEVKYEGGARKAKVAATKDASGNYHLNVVPL